MDSFWRNLFGTFWEVGWDKLFVVLERRGLSRWEVVSEQGKDDLRRLRILVDRVPGGEGTARSSEQPPPSK